MILHKHHKIPKHMGGTDDSENLIELTIEEHAEAHRKLYEEYGHWQDRLAWLALSGQVKGAKIAHEARRLRMIGNKLWLGRKHSEKSKEKMGPKKGTKFTNEHKQKLSIARQRRIITEETKRKLSKPRINRRKIYEITFPDGRIEIVVGLVDFCKKYNLTQPNMDKVARGLRPHHKGFKCRKINE